MKNDGKMSFRDFIFPINPAVIRIQHRKKLAVQSVPFGNDNISDSGEAGRVITGEGEFAGGGCINDFLALKQTAMKGPGMLYIPSQEPIYAYAENIELKASDMEGAVGYSFRFIEQKEHPGKSPRFAEGNGTDCLWDYAWRYGADIDLLLSLNPHIRRPDMPVSAAERVRLC